MDPFASLPEPVARAWERSLTSGRAAMSRRRLLAAGAGLAGAAALPALGACGIPAADTGGEDGEAAAARDYSKKEKELAFSNWPLYIDVDDENENIRPTLERFQERSGIRVKYTEDVNDNVEFFGRIKPQLAAGQDTGRDLVCLSDFMAGRLIRNGWAQRLDPRNLPHANVNLEPRFRNAAHDPGRQFTMPWAGLATVVAYNKKATGGREVSSVAQLMEDDSLKGKVSLLTEMQDTIGMTLIDMGKSPTKFTDDDFDAALARVQRAVDDDQLRRFTGNDYTEELVKGDIAACLAWAGDIVQLQLDTDDIEFVIPAKGYLYATDDLLVPARARHKTNAEKLIDFYYRPDVAAELAAWVNYICPVVGARAEMRKIDASLADYPLIFPDRQMIDKGQVFMSMNDDKETAYQDKWSKVIGA
ncbi:spermidine/putrescine ABC transporter substrate-binding protein [Streptomyces sp. 184]|uniref:polyamine ABC transporter substrate-binding protein n=1 Tax=Streptomyces sp. 184 TaxID=1827526 RepID=UPI0038914FD0